MDSSKNLSGFQIKNGAKNAPFFIISPMTKPRPTEVFDHPGSDKYRLLAFHFSRILENTDKPSYQEITIRGLFRENGGKYDDVFVVRDGQKLRFDEVAAAVEETT